MCSSFQAIPYSPSQTMKYGITTNSIRPHEKTLQADLVCLRLVFSHHSCRSESSKSHS
ncbi:unnamed protein product [Linum tenue]|uniref:Uncharacterized protein n=1 Tax=Linum tenue TaxID=586396 RepID=A0AAV0JI37_9ROSI|nr:unnamed protein product [Linum tenue]